MQSVMLSIGGWIIFVCITEVLMWRLYKKRALNLNFPERYGTLFHFFTLKRVRLLVCVHTILLSVFVAAFHIWLW